MSARGRKDRIEIQLRQDKSNERYGEEVSAREKRKDRRKRLLNSNTERRRRIGERKIRGVRKYVEDIFSLRNRTNKLE